MDSMLKAYAAEFVGTFVLVFLGAASVALAPATVGPIMPALAHGFAIIFAVYALGHLSGAHVNPAITISIAIAGAIRPGQAVGYILSQLAAAVVAAFTLNFILPGQASHFGAFSFQTSTEAAMVMEAILTFILATVVLQAAVSGRAGNMAGMAIGLTLAGCIMAGGPVTGASLNPARTLGPALVAADLDQAWVYVVGTIIGASLAALLHRLVWNKGNANAT